MTHKLNLHDALVIEITTLDFENSLAIFKINTKDLEHDFGEDTKDVIAYRIINQINELLEVIPDACIFYGRNIDTTSSEESIHNLLDASVELRDKMIPANKSLMMMDVDFDNVELCDIAGIHDWKDDEEGKVNMERLGDLMGDFIDTLDHKISFISELIEDINVITQIRQEINKDK